MPFSCGHCTNTWTGLRSAHCSKCHHTFSGLRGFDLHRDRGRCFGPAEKGLELVDGLWKQPGTRQDPE